MKVLVFSEKDDVAFELLAKARSLFTGASVGAALLLPSALDRTDEYFARGADVVYRAAQGAQVAPRPEAWAGALHDIVASADVETVFLGSTRRGKQASALLAQKLSCGCVTDAIDVRLEGEALHADRYSLAGNTIATEVIGSPRRVVAIMPHAFKAQEKGGARGTVVDALVRPIGSKVALVETRPKKGERVNLEEAKVIVGVGKGFAKQEDLELARQLASVLKAEIGCTRPLAVDLKWLAEDRSIGLSSKKVAPELYIAVGISGQIQHTVGVMRSRTIVAIDRNEDAPIFSIADYGIVGDLYKVLPYLTAELKKVASQ